MSTPTVAESALSTANMLDGNEYVYPVVIKNSRLFRWTSVDWIDAGEPTEADLHAYPTVVPG